MTKEKRINARGVHISGLWGRLRQSNNMSDVRNWPLE